MIPPRKARRPPKAPPLFNDTSESIFKNACSLLDAARAVRNDVVANITPETATFANTLLPLLQEQNSRLGEARRLELLQHVSPDEHVRQASREADALFADFVVARSMDVELYKLLAAVSERKESLHPESQRALDQELRFLRSNGLSLSEEKRDRLRQIKRKVDHLSNEAEKNIKEEPFEIWVSEAALTGVPAPIIQTLELGESTNSGKRRITMAKVNQVMSHAEQSGTRRLIYIAYSSVCSANVNLLEELVVLRDEAARLLGYSNHADWNLQNNFTEKSLENLNSFLDDLRKRLCPTAKDELVTLKRLKAQHERSQAADIPFYVWDYSYYSRIARQLEDAVDEDKVAGYFPLEEVVDRMLELFSFVFSICFVELCWKDVEAMGFVKDSESFVWHNDVKLYSVWDTTGPQANSGEFLGYLYTDLFPRPGKFTHFADLAVRPGFSDANGLRHYPATALICNFPKPTPTQPSLLRHQDIWLLAHELGHGLHDLVSKTQYARFHGPEFSGDFNEAPSQLLEHWCWDSSVLKKLSRHYSTLSPEYLELWKKSQANDDAAVEEEIPDTLVTGFLKAKEASRGSFLLRSVQHSIFDLQINQPSTAEAAASMNTTLIWNRIRQDITGLLGPEQDGTGQAMTYSHATFPHFFRHAAGYFCYLSSQVYAADMFVTAFKGDPINAEQGARYRRNILEPGASEDEMVLLINFLGRTPGLEAFYEVFGITIA